MTDAVPQDDGCGRSVPNGRPRGTQTARAHRGEGLRILARIIARELVASHTQCVGPTSSRVLSRKSTDEEVEE
jgi:hypothetical protein